MLSYCPISSQENLMSAVNCYQQHQSSYADFRSTLCELFQQISTLGNDLQLDTYSTITVLLAQQASASLRKFKETEDFACGPRSRVDEFSCQLCLELLYKPVTLLCGHTFCLSCLQKKQISICVVCGAVIEEEKLCQYRINVALSNILEKWHPNETAARSLCSLGTVHMKDGKYKEAICEFNKALSYAPNSHTSLVYRAEASLLIGDYSKAVKDAQKATQLDLNFFQAHYVKAEGCYKQRSFEKALLSYLISFALDPSKSYIKQKIVVILESLIQQETRRRLTNDNEKLCLKRRLSKEYESPVPVKHAFCRRSMEDYGGGEKYPRSLTLSSHEMSASSPSVSSFCNSNLASSGPFQPSLSLKTERTLDSIFIRHFCQSGDTSSSKSEMFHREVDPSLIDASDFECSLCFRLLHNPVCTPCGHIFCQFCIERSLDHGTHCPLCKQSIEDSLAEQLIRLHANCDYVTNSIIKLYLPSQHEERAKQHKDEIEELSRNQPVFVCTIAYPSISCPLHIFEPRYRLMLRRCLEFNKKEFGMCMPGKTPGTHCQIGTLLKVHNVTYFPDGRSVVECSGIRRFKTTNCRVQDGYNVAKLNYIVDREPRNRAATQELSNKVYHVALSWYNSLPENFRDAIIRHFGSFPEKDDKEGENGPDWHWWVLAVVDPVKDLIKTTVLSKDSFYDRLLIMHRIFQCLQKRSNENHPTTSQPS